MGVGAGMDVRMGVGVAMGMDVCMCVGVGMDVCMGVGVGVSNDVDMVSARTPRSTCVAGYLCFKITLYDDESIAT